MDENNTLKENNGLISAGDIRVITIIGQIEGHTELQKEAKTTKYEHIIPMITDIALDKTAKGILTILNTVGGDVEAGLALSELISGINKPCVSLVLGGGHSIGVPLAVSSDYSFIAKTATMTVHPIRTSGLMINVPQTFRYYEKMQNRVEDFVCSHCKITRERFIRLMNEKDEMADDIGTVLVGEQAVKEGLIDEVGGLNDALLKLRQLIEKGGE